MFQISCLASVLILASAQAQDAPQPSEAKLPMCGLAPAKIHPNLCVVKYRISTNSPECQAFFDQGLAFFYSYVWMEACRSFETACRRDPVQGHLAKLPLVDDRGEHMVIDEVLIFLVGVT